MFTREIAYLASLRCAGVARGRLAADEGVKMSQSAGAAAGGVDRHSMDVVNYIVQRKSLQSGGQYSRNGPPEVGRLEKLMVKATPTPPGPAVAEMPPFTFPRGSEGLKNSTAGRAAV